MLRNDPQYQEFVSVTEQCFKQEISNAPTVKAIPIEWIEEWGWKNGMSESMSLRVMIDDWEKENERDQISEHKE